MADTRYGPPEWPPSASSQDQYGRTPYIPRQTGYGGYPPADGRTAPGPPADTGYAPPPRHGAAGTAPPRSRTSVPRHSSGEWRTVGDRRPPQEPAPAPARTGREDRSPWHWLLLIPIVLPLMPGLYNRIEPTLLGLPFFYWGQLGFAFLASAVIAFVHLKVR